jgi:hypothetical protein
MKRLCISCKQCVFDEENEVFICMLTGEVIKDVTKICEKYEEETEELPEEEL